MIRKGRDSVAEPMQTLTALGRHAPAMLEIGAIRVTERFDLALAAIACRKGRELDCATAAKAAGVPLPGPACAETAGHCGAFWVAPAMWFVEAPFDSHEDIVAQLKPTFGDAASITEQTDAWVRFDITASDEARLLERLLERLCNVDFATAPDGFATRTVVEHLGCYLIRRGAGEVTLYGGRSSARSLLHAITVAAASVV